ncbi:TPA: haloacid dehalogenase [Candidatus Sumerlaeota bacterium]|nr:haloacid dehalogenase [Candidatus Sumerlaeota bacterium]
MSFTPNHPFFVGVDSDGCVMDTMDLKQQECFVPNIIKYFHLQAVSRYAREAVEFINLHSHWRGTNRFPALILMLDLLCERPEVKKRGVAIPRLESLRRWLKTEKRLGNPSLAEAVQTTGDAELQLVLDWSVAINKDIAEMANGLEPFPGTKECVTSAAERADVAVVSQTGLEALEREWDEHGMVHLVRALYGQECGSKSEHLHMATHGKYEVGRVLMVGDALGDRDAAQNNGALFFPILPAREEESWQQLREEGLERFFNGTFAGDYQAKLLQKFETMLPTVPPWNR